MLKKYSTQICLYLVAALIMLLCMPLMAAASDTVTVNMTPAFISISNAPNNWTVNGDYGGSGVVNTDTVYYSNPYGDTTAPNATIPDAACRFEITNSSTVATDITVNFGNFTGGDAVQNSNTGNNTASNFAAWSWFSGDTYPDDRVVAKSTGSDVGEDGLAATTNIYWGVEIETPSGAWTSADQQQATVTCSAVLDS